MIAFVYGQACAFLVEPAARDLCAAVKALGGDAVAVTLDALNRDAELARSIRQVYALPFDGPGRADPAAYFAALMPRAESVVPFPVQDLCWDKVATEQRLLAKGVPVPDTLISSDPTEVFAFVREHEYAILKQRYSCGGAGHFVLWVEGGELMGDCGSHRYRMHLGGEERAVLVGDRLTYPGPFYVQRLVADITRKGVTPPQALRAYVVDRTVQFWTERYRETYQRPSDWIVTVARGARYRLLQQASEEAEKIALRAADAVGMRFGAVDLVRTPEGGTYALEVDVDSRQMMIDRQFKNLPEYRDCHAYDTFIAEALLGMHLPAEPEPPPPRRPPRRRPGT